MLIYHKEIRKLIEDFFRSKGCGVKTINADLVEVLFDSAALIENEKDIRSEFRDFLDEDKNSLFIAYSAEQQRLQQGALLATAGSPLFKAIRASLEKKGKTGFCYLEFNVEKAAEISGGLPDVPKFVNGKAEPAGTAFEYRGILRLYYLVTIEGEEKTEELIPLYYEADTGRLMENVPSDLIEGNLLLKPLVEGSKREMIKPEQIQKASAKDLRNRLSPLVGRLSGLAEDSLKKDEERLRGYFEDLEQQAKNRTELNLIKKAFKRKTEEIREKHSLNLQADLVNSVIIYVPLIRYRIKFTKDEQTFYIETFFDLLTNRYLPYNCPKCGKETSSLVICEIHGIECAEDCWTCPVCGEVRCPLCEHNTCAVDGRKKDPECTFKCRFCHQNVGLDVKAFCERCNAWGCISCINECRIHGMKICPDCGESCSYCHGTFCKGQLEGCDFCQSKSCPSCGVITCSICGKQACSEHHYRCVGCNEVICQDCLGGVDLVSKKPMCRKCSYTCPSCKNTVVKKNALWCKEGNEPICFACSIKCAKCGNYYCKNHVERCQICREYVCADHTGICPSCGGVVCEEHLFTCHICGVKYCRRCKSKQGQQVCGLCANLKPLKKKSAKTFLLEVAEEKRELSGISDWEYGEGRNIYIFYGKSIISNSLFAIDKHTKKIVTFRKMGLFDKIKNFFNE